jgi:hypothetical protein
MIFLGASVDVFAGKRCGGEQAGDHGGDGFFHDEGSLAVIGRLLRFTCS